MIAVRSLMKKAEQDHPEEHGDLLTIPEAAGFLRCHPNTIRAWIRQGRLIPVAMGAEQVNMLKKEEIQALRKPLEKAGVIVKEDKSAFPVVGIGASAGGLDAISRLLEKLPTDLGLAYVYVPHIEHGQEPMLADLLRRKTSMPVIIAENGMKLDPDRVYIGVGGMHLSIVSGIITLRTLSLRTGSALRPVDAFLSSLAQEYQNNAIGIILSGHGMDGTEGLRAIKAEDGLTIVQDASAQDPAMPQSAIDAGVVDLVMPPEHIGRTLAELVKDLFSGGKVSIPGKHENELRRILAYMEEQRGVDFTQYKESTIHRRIIRRMVLSNCRKLSDYSTLLRGTPTEVETLYNDLLINVTSFFRDPQFFKALSKRIFPALLKGRTTNEPLRIWIPACSGGEEVVSVAITLLEYLGDKSLSTPVQIFATDLNERAIEKARMGIYKKNALQAVSQTRIKRFFTHVDGHYQVIKSIRDMCVFSKHDLLKDPPFSKQDLISCQNVLIYLDNNAQGRVLKSFHYALKPQGFLVLGKSETTVNAGDIFVQPEREFKFYTKRSKGSGRIDLDVHYRPSLAPVGVATHAPTLSPPTSAALDLDREVDKLLLQRFVPPSVLVNGDLDILRFRGATAPFLGPSSGKASLNLLKMVRDDLAYELRGLLQKARKEHIPVRKGGIPISRENVLRDVCIEVVPMGAKREAHYLVLFKDEGATALADTSLAGRTRRVNDAREKRIALLEQELHDAREHMRLITEESESMMQELQSANEEVVSSNEELQSMNEELETSKEELQSINEEFATINEELQSRNDLLRDSEERLQLATRTGKVGVWDWDIQQDRIIWTDAVYEMHGVDRETFDGRVQSFQALIHPDDRDRVATAIERTLKVDAQYELEFRVLRPDGRTAWLFTNASIMRANGRPIRLIGATIDITERKRAEEALQKRTRTLELMNAVSDTLIAELDVDKIVQAVTDAGREASGAAFGAFFYNVTNDAGESYMLYTLSGAPREAFAGFPMPRNTEVFAPTFRGEGVVRVADILKDPRYGKMGPHHGMPEGHLPVRSYLAVPVTSREGKVLGGLFYGHPEPDRFEAEAEEVLVSLSAQAALALDNANLHKALQRELEDQRRSQAALRVSEERVRLLADNMDQLAWTADPNGASIWFNQRWTEFSGIPVEELRERTGPELHHPDHRERVRTSLRAAVDRGEPWEDTFPLKAKDGSWHWFLSRAIPIRDAEGHIAQWFGTCTDVTKLRSVQEDLKESEERFRLLGDNMAQLAWICDAEGIPVWYNKQWEVFTGVPTEKLTDLDTVRNTLHPDHLQRVRRSHERGMSSGTTWEETFPILSKDGVYHWFLSRLVPVRDPAGNIVRWFGTNTDITEQREAAQRIQENEQRLKTMFDHAPIGVVLADALTGNLVDANTEFLDMVGFSLEEMRGRSSLEIGTNMDPGVREHMLDEIRKQGTVRDREVRAFHRSGRPIDVLVNATMVAIGGAPYVLVHMEDVTERRQTQRSMQRLANIVESSEDAIMSKDLNSIVNSWNRGAERIFGYTAAEMIGQPITKLFPPDREDEEPRILDRIRRGERIEHFETVRVRKDGSLVDVSISISPLRDAEGRVIGASKIVRDVSKNKQLEEEVRATSTQLQLVTDNMPVAVARCSRDMHYLWASRGYYEWIDLPLGTVQGKHIAEVLGAGSFKKLEPYFERVLRGERVEYEEQLIIPSIGARWINAIYAPVYEEADEPAGWIAVITDITRRKELEAALQDADKHKDHFLATLAHELRSPLAPLKNGLQLLRLVEDDAGERANMQDMMERQLDHMVRLVDDLMDLNRISRGKIELRKERIDLNKVIDAAIETCRPIIEQQEHHLERTGAGQKVQVEGDPARLTQVVANLLSNAAKYTPPGGSIALSLERSEHSAVIRVRDNGIGIDPTGLPRVFDMFAQVAPRHSTSAGGGLGIGLNIVQRLVTMHDGTVEARSEGRDKGSEFIVRLPVLKEGTASVERTEPPEGTSAVAVERKRVLVVDDNTDAALSMSLLLRKRGHTVEVAHDGLSALQLGAEFKPDIVLMDIGMPNMDGYEACARMRKEKWGKRATIVALSGWGQQEDRMRSQEAGFDRHVVKPIDRATLEAITLS